MYISFNALKSSNTPSELSLCIRVSADIDTKEALQLLISLVGFFPDQAVLNLYDNETLIEYLKGKNAI